MTDDQTCDEESGSKDESEAQNDAPPPTLLIWLTRLVSGAILVTIVGYLIYLSTLQDVPPEFEITPKFDAVVEHENHYALPVDVKNGATEAVTQVKVEITFQGETRELILPLMGQGEIASLEVVFERRPTENGFDAMVVGYQSP